MHVHNVYYAAYYIIGTAVSCINADIAYAS